MPGNLKPSVARKLAVRHAKLWKVAVRHTCFVCLTASYLATGGFIKLFHKILWFFHDYSGVFKFHDFSMHGTFIGDFTGFQWLSERVGTLSRMHPMASIILTILLEKYRSQTISEPYQIPRKHGFMFDKKWQPPRLLVRDEIGCRDSTVCQSSWCFNISHFKFDTR